MLVRVYHSKGMTKVDAGDGETVGDFKKRVVRMLGGLEDAACTLSRTQGGSGDLDDAATCGQAFKRGLKLYITVRTTRPPSCPRPSLWCHRQIKRSSHGCLCLPLTARSSVWQTLPSHCAPRSPRSFPKGPDSFAPSAALGTSPAASRGYSTGS